MNLDETLDLIEKNVIQMSNIVIHQHEQCIEILQTHNKEIALNIVKTDEFINRFEEDINNQAMASFALLNPIASDLRRVLVAIKIATELERIADYAKGLASFIIKDRDPEEKEITHYAVKMEEKVIFMLKKAIKTYMDRNLETAFEIPKFDDEIDAMLDAFKEELTKENTNLILSSKQVFYLSGLFRNIERSGDHIINICEHIIYLCKGIQYDFG